MAVKPRSLPVQVVGDAPLLVGLPDVTAIPSQRSVDGMYRLSQEVWQAATGTPQQAVQVLLPALRGL